MSNTINSKERARRRELTGQARSLITRTLPIEDADESSLMLGHNGFYLQIAFSELHPLMVICMACPLNGPGVVKDLRIINILNLKCVLGSHAVNMEAGCYSFRAALWLDTELTRSRFLEILDRCTEEAVRAFAQLTHRSEVSA